MKDNYFRLVGNYFGYPSCCIESFIDFVNNGTKRSKNQMLFFSQGLGFVPCLNCADFLVKK